MVWGIGHSLREGHEDAPREDEHGSPHAKEEIKRRCGVQSEVRSIRHDVNLVEHLRVSY